MIAIVMIEKEKENERERKRYTYIYIYIHTYSHISEYSNKDSRILSSANILVGSQILPRSVVGFAGTKEPCSSRLCHNKTWLLGPGKGA